MTDVEKKYLKSEGFYLNVNEIQYIERIREHADKDDVESLKKSIVELGQLQPVILTRDKKLIAGGSRVKACADLQREVWAVYTDEVDKILLLKIQLHENIKRANLTAVEETLLKDEIYIELLARTSGRANQTDLAKEIQQSVGLISEDLKHAQYIKQLPEFFKDCKTKTEIRQKVKRMERKAEEYVLQKAADAMSPDVTLDRLATITGMTHEQIRKEKERFSGETSDIVMGNELSVEEKIKEYNQRLMFGSWEDGLPKVKKEQIDLMLLDPPWGIDLQEKIEAGMLKGDAYDDSEEEFLKTFPKLIQLCYNKMRADAHLYCFFAIRHYRFVWDTFHDPFGDYKEEKEGGKRGFSGIDRPIVIHKEGRASGRQGDHWPVSSYEMIGLFKKGRRAMNHGGISDLQTVPWIAPTAKRGHPSAKPSEVYRRILEWSARPGDTICDPTYGSGAAFLACEERADLKLNWFGWETDPGARRVALMNLTEFQVSLLTPSPSEKPSILSESEQIEGVLKEQPYKGEERKVIPIPSSFNTLVPETEMWRRYWNKHPEEQMEMLIFRKKWRDDNARQQA